jgi:hypothetical protein
LAAEGREWALAPNDDGLIAFRVPPERTRFELTFEEPASVKLAYIVSGFMWIGFGIVSLFLGMRTIYAVRKTS